MRLFLDINYKIKKLYEPKLANISFKGPFALIIDY